MAAPTTVTIGDQFESLISRLVEDGHYRSAGDVVEAGLRLLEAHEAKARALDEALLAGERSGEPRPFDFQNFQTRKRTAHMGG